MSFKKTTKSGITFIKIENDRLDSTIASDLKTELLLIVDDGAKNVVVDLTEVNYADSSGLGALLFGLRQLKNLGGKLSLLRANKKIMNLIRIARLEDILVNFQNENEALENIKYE